MIFECQTLISSQPCICRGQALAEAICGQKCANRSALLRNRLLQNFRIHILSLFPGSEAYNWAATHIDNSYRKLGVMDLYLLHTPHVEELWPQFWQAMIDQFQAHHSRSEPQYETFPYTYSTTQTPRLLYLRQFQCPDLMQRSFFIELDTSPKLPSVNCTRSKPRKNFTIDTRDYTDKLKRKRRNTIDKEIREAEPSCLPISRGQSICDVFFEKLREVGVYKHSRFLDDVSFFLTYRLRGQAIIVFGAAPRISKSDIYDEY